VSIVSEGSDDQAGKTVLHARLNGDTIRAKWPGKRWHGAYKDIYAACDAAHGDGLESFVIDYVDEEN
jgi:hypothetical protein